MIVLLNASIDIATGQSLMLWSIRVAVVCYLFRLFLFMREGGVRQEAAQSSHPSHRKSRLAQCLLWNAGCLFYCIHVALAFQFVHAWSHEAALEHTAVETHRLTGILRGEGIWVNYAFTLVWIMDCIRLNVAVAGRRPTNRRIDVAVQIFFAFIFFNATVIFGPRGYRWLIVPVIILLACPWRRRNAATVDGRHHVELR